MRTSRTLRSSGGRRPAPPWSSSPCPVRTCTLQLRGDTRLEPPPLPENLGTKVEFGIWFRVAAGDHDPEDEIVLRIKSGETVIAEGSVFPGDHPPDTWHHLTTAYDPALGMDGCIRHDSAGLTVAIEVDSKSDVWVDELRGRPFAYDRWPLEDAGFDVRASLGTAWVLVGDGAIDRGVKPYFGERTLLLGDTPRASVYQRVPSQSHGLLPQTGDVPEAGAWVRISHGPEEPWGSVRLQVWHEHVLADPAGGGTTRLQTLLAEGELPVASVPAGRWTYLETNAESAVPLPPRLPSTLETNVVVRLAKHTSRRVRFDFVQVGEGHSVDGNPERVCFSNYMARFRNPSFAPDPLVDDPTNGLGRRWRSWFWDRPPACDADPAQYVHDPTRLRGGADPHDAGRRDLAVSSWGEKYLPLLGAYDSRDPAVIAFHVELAEAVGVDAFMLGWYGQKAVDMDECSPRVDSVNGPTLEALYDVVEALSSDLKVAVKFNLQRHLNGSFATAAPGCAIALENTREEMRAGIRDDLVWLVDRYYGHRATLKREGRMVVSVFDPERVFQDETGAWTSFDAADWASIKAEVEATTGEVIELWFDDAPRLSMPIEEAGEWYAGIASGLASWRLVPCRLALYRSFADFQDDEQRFITGEAVRVQFREQINGRPYRWWRQDDAHRVGIAIAYPGFDDTGVAGWGGLNGTCQNHGPRCARIVPSFGFHWYTGCDPDSRNCFLEMALQEALGSGMSWLQLPTWNDWNELTAIEPMYSATYVQRVLSGGTVSDDGHDRMWVLGRLLTAQAGIAAFKGRPADPLAIDDVVEGFLRANGGTGYE